jgi:hypothetical protein
MEQEYVLSAVHEEFARRIEDENDRQNKRLDALEVAVKEMTRLTVAVEKMAVSIEGMAAEQKRQGERLTAIEEKPAKRWDAVITGIIGAIVGALGAALASGIIH